MRPMTAFRHAIPIGFSDVDHAGIVYYPVFFHYFHLTLEAFFRERLGSRSYVKLLDEERVGFPAVSTQCEYKAPLRFGDIADVEMSIDRLGERSITFRFRVYRRPEPESNGAGVGTEPVLAAEGSTTSAVIDMDAFRAKVIPDSLRRLFEPLT